MEAATANPTVNPPETWVEKYGDYLYRFAMSRLKNPDLAADCVQETLLAGIRNFDRFDGSRDVKFWLRGIMRNKIVDHFRKLARERQVDIGEDAEILESALYKHTGIPTMSPEPWKFDPRKAFDQVEFWEAFEQCVEQLEGPAHQAFVLKVLDDMETEEVCKVMGIEANYLWVLLHRARKQIKALLEQYWNKSPETDRQE